MGRRPTHYAAKYKSVCRFCKAEFLSKKKNGDVCYAVGCQRLKESERRARQYQKHKEQATG